MFDLSSLTHRQRMRAVLSLGRRAATGEPGARADVEALARGGIWERWLAVHAANGDRDAERLVRAIDDPAESVRNVAIAVAAHVLDDAALARLLEGARGPATQRRVLAALHRRRRRTVIDRFLQARLADADRAVVARWIDDLPRGTADGFDAHREAFVALASAGGWRRLVLRHPALARRELAARVAGSGPLDAWTLHRIEAALRPLAERSPADALAVLAALFARGERPTDPRWSVALRRLARRDPVGTFELLRALRGGEAEARPPGAFAAVRFDDRPERLGGERIAWLVRHAWHALPDGRDGRRWMRALPAEDRALVLRTWVADGRGGFGGFLLGWLAEGDPLRAAAFARWRAGVQAPDGSVAPDHLRALPPDLRHAEARRCFDLPAVAREPYRRLAYGSLLPFAEARERLDPWIGHPEGAWRSAALRAWIDALRLDRGALPRALAAAAERRYEQDPVRLALLQALGALPLRVWAPGGALAPGTIAGVERVLSDAYEAADLSDASAAAAEAIATKLFRLDPAWGAAAIERSLRVRGRVYAQGLLVGLTARQVERLAPALEALAARWHDRERWAAFSALVAAIGRHLPACPGIVRRLAEVAAEVPFAGYAAAALALLSAHAPRAFAELAPPLVEADPSTVCLPPIARLLALHGQDLLDRVLQVRPMVGRYATGRTDWVLALDLGWTRWAPRQLGALAAGLDQLLADPQVDQVSALAAARTRLRLPFVDAAPALRLANDPRPAVREAAIRALARFEGPEAVPLLLECLGDERARFAIYALRRRFAAMSEPEVLAVLRAAPRAKVTVAKEVVRLLGELALPEAFDELLAIARGPLHRDVRIAVLRALWPSIERPDAWPLLEAAASDPDWVVASRLLEVPTRQLSPEVDARFCALLAGVLARPEPEARIGLVERAAYAPIRDAGRVLFRAIVARCAAPTSQERTVATRAALARLLPSEIELVAAAIVGPPDDHRGLVDRLAVLRPQLAPWAGTVRNVGRRVFLALDGDPLRVVHAIEVAAGAFETEALAQRLEALAKRGWLHTDAMNAALAAVARCANPSELDRRFARSADPRLRRLGLAALVASAGPGEGWTAERRTRLDTYRRDPDPAVAGPATFVFPPDR